MNVENYAMKRSLELLVGTHEYASIGAHAACATA